MNENMSLDKTFESIFSRKVKKLKERVKTQDVNNTEEKVEKPEHGVVYVGHIPHGFYENEMLAYFKQFGKVSNLRVCRSKATGQSKGYAFVEFADSEVAKIAAETMNNYLMFSKRIIARYIPSKKAQSRIYKGASWSKLKYPMKKIREKVNRIRNKNTDETNHLKKSKAMILSVNKNLRKLHSLGINYTFQAVDDSNNLNAMILQPSSSSNQEVVSNNSKIKKRRPRRKVKKEKVQ